MEHLCNKKNHDFNNVRAKKFMLITANLYQLSIMSAFFNYLRALGALFISQKFTQDGL